MHSFFPMRRGDRWYLLTLILVAIIAFLPWSRATRAGGLPIFAWLMVALMILAPSIALVRILTGANGSRHDAQSREGRR